jgi:hypothetical protein
LPWSWFGGCFVSVLICQVCHHFLDGFAGVSRTNTIFEKPARPAFKIVATPSASAIFFSAKKIWPEEQSAVRLYFFAHAALIYPPETK